MKKKLISIIINCHNGEKYLHKTLESILHQKYKNYEVIFVDDGSTDNTRNILKNIKNESLKILHHDRNYGKGKAIQTGIKESNGKYLAFLDSDDWWLPNKLMKCVDRINNSKDGIDLIYHSLYISNKRKNIYTFKKIFARQLLMPVFKDLILNNNPIATSSVLVSKEIVKKAGAFSEDKSLIAAEDYDLWLRISKLTDKFESIKAPLGYWFDGGNTSSPLLTLKYLDTLRKIHIDPLILKTRKKLPIWWLYSKGRSLFLINDYKEAKIYLKKVFLRNSNLSVKIKSLYMLTKIYFFK